MTKNVEKEFEEEKLTASSKYKAFEGAVDKCLKGFELSTEWADLIAALAKLNKILSTYSYFGCVPKSVMVSKRLSQCLHPSLPFGVHLKALECYKQIFDLLGPTALSKELHLYAVGLFPLLPNATIKVKSALLDFYRKYFLPLGSQLIPALSGFLNGVLPALEEGSEFYDGCMKLLNDVCDQVGSDLFFTCLWNCACCCHATRLPALTFLLSKFEKKAPIEDQLYLIGIDMNVMVRSLCHIADDSNVLVQRGLLDFVIVAFPLDSEYLLSDDFCRLMRKCIFLILRRDLSLNRRLFTWLGARVGVQDRMDAAYFEKYALPLVMISLTSLLNDSNVAFKSCSSIIRIVVHFLDKPEIGRPILEKILIKCLSTASYLHTNSNAETDMVEDDEQEFYKMLDLLLSGLERDFIWYYMVRCFGQSGLVNNHSSDKRELEDFCGILLLLFKFAHLLPHVAIDTDCCFNLIGALLTIPTKQPSLPTCTVLKMASAAVIVGLHLASACQAVNDGWFVVMDKLDKTMESLAHAIEQATPDTDLSDRILCTLFQVAEKLFDCPVIEWTEDGNTIEWLGGQRLLTLLLASSLSGQLTVAFKAMEAVLLITVQSANLRPQSNSPNSIALVPLAKRLAREADLDLKISFHRYFEILWDAVQPSGPLEREAALLFLLLHSVYPECETFLTDRLTSEDDETRHDAAYKFTYLSYVMRENGQSPFPSCPRFKPLTFASIAMLAGVDQDTSTGRLCSLWYSDIVQHDDLPNLLQTICLRLADPQCARVSVQYLSVRQCEPDRSLYQLVVDSNRSIFHSNFQCECYAEEWAKDFRRRTFMRTKRRLSKPILDEQARGHFHPTSLQEACCSICPLDESECIHCLVLQMMADVVDSIANELDREINERMLKQVASFEQLDNASSSFGKELCSDCASSTFANDLDFIYNAAEHSPSTSDSYWYHPLHAHLLIYHEVFDLGKATHCFELFLKMLCHSPDAFVQTLLNTPVHSTSMGRCTGGDLLLRCFNLQKVAVLAKHSAYPNHADGADASDSLPDRASCLYIDLVLTLSLYTLRSFFTNSPTVRISTADLKMSRQLRLHCLRFLSRCLVAISQLAMVSGGALCLHVADVLDRRKFSKCLLHLLMAAVIDIDSIISSSSSKERPSAACNLSESIVRFNLVLDDNDVEFFHLYQWRLLEVVEAYHELEFYLMQSIKNAEGDRPSTDVKEGHVPVLPSLRAIHFQQSVSSKKLFLVVVLKAMKADCRFHEIWLRSVVNSMPYLDNIRATAVVGVTEQALRNIEAAYRQFIDGPVSVKYPDNYAPRLLELITVLLHQCLLDTHPVRSFSRRRMEHGSVNRDDLHFIGERKVATSDIFANLIRAFNNNEEFFGTDAGVIEERVVDDVVHSYGLEVLSFLPNILYSATTISRLARQRTTAVAALGAIERVPRLLVEMLSPLLLAYPTQVLSSMAMVWSKCRDGGEYSECQLEVVRLLGQIKVMPLERLTTNVRETLKRPTSVSTRAKLELVPLEMSLLEMTHGMVTNAAQSALKASYRSLCSLLADAHTISLYPQCKFMLFKIFATLVNCMSDEDKDVLPELQDLCAKLVSSLIGIVGWQLAQPYWLKRTLVLKSQLEKDSSSSDNLKASLSASSLNDITLLFGEDDMKRDTLCSQQALSLLSEHSFDIFDRLYKSEDKDKVIQLLQSLWTNLQPFLRVHSAGNASNFRQVSLLLSRFSALPLVKTQWRKALLDLLMESSFFRMDESCLSVWAKIIGNLVLQERALFRDILSKLSPSPSLLTSKEQEYEMRASSLRKISFLLISSSCDHHMANLHDIQERVTENIRLSHIPHVYTAVFICFRSLLLRMSTQYLLSFWPILIAELVHVLTQLEQHLSGEFTQTDDYKCAREDQWLDLYLAASKLLGALYLFPVDKLGQFQLYNWAFYDSKVAQLGNFEQKHRYVPWALRINNMLQETQKVGNQSAHGDLKSLKRFMGRPRLSSMSELIELYAPLCTVDQLSVSNSESAEEMLDLIHTSILCDLADGWS
uniref:Dopey_N domain-containing protein n=1 Tax=Trichuris muris TaxID=70415 RepID=A0A5S6Q960_TRIMR